MNTDVSLFRTLVSRQIRREYLQNVSGMAWLVVQPILLLAVYAFVFGTIFQARVPADLGVGFVPWLAVVFWPWNAFSEAVLRGSGAVTEHAALIGKVAFRTELLPLATVTAVFLMHTVGFLVILVLLQVFGTDVQWAWLPAAAGVLLLLYGLAVAVALVAGTLQVFIRDLAQFLPPLLTLWFFTSPILYPVAALPDSLRWLMELNPISWFAERLRDALLAGQWTPRPSDALAVLGITLAVWLGLRFFRRYAGHFEDFL